MVEDETKYYIVMYAEKLNVTSQKFDSRRGSLIHYYPFDYLRDENGKIMSWSERWDALFFLNKHYKKEYIHPDSLLPCHPSLKREK